MISVVASPTTPISSSAKSFESGSIALASTPAAPLTEATAAGT